MANYAINKIGADGEAGTMNLEVRAYPIAEPKGNVKGYASVTIDGMFGVHGVSIVEGKNGLFASMPQTRDSKGEYRDVFHPVTAEGRKTLNDAVVAEYGAALDAMVAEKQSTVDRIREGQKAMKERVATKADAPEQAKGKGKDHKGDENR